MKKNRKRDPRRENGSLFKKILSPGIWRRITSVLLAFVVFLTTYMMILPALTIDLDLVGEELGMDVARAEGDFDRFAFDDASASPPGVGEYQTGNIDELPGSADALSGSFAVFTEESGAVPLEDETSAEFTAAENSEIPGIEIAGDDSTVEVFDDTLTLPEEPVGGPVEGTVEIPEEFGEEASGDFVEIPEEFSEEFTETSGEYPEEMPDSIPADELAAVGDAVESEELFIDSVEATEDVDEESEHVENSAEVSASAHVLKAEGIDYRVTVSYTDEAEIPEGAGLQVTEIFSGESTYDQYVNEASEALSTEKRIMSVDCARFFDITIINGEETVEPKAPVTVLVELADSFAAEETAAVIHYTEDEAEVMEKVDAEEAAASIEEAEAAAEESEVESNIIEETLSPELSSEMPNDSAEPAAPDAQGTEIVDEQAAEEVPLVGAESLEEEIPFVGAGPLEEEEPIGWADAVGETEEAGFAEPMNPIAFIADSFSVYGFVTATLEKTVLASDGQNYKISVTCGPDAGIPEDAELSVVEITQDAYDYEDYVANVENILGNGDKSVEYVRLFDIKIVSSDDASVQYQPAEGSSVDVHIELADTGNSELSVVHFGEDAEAEIGGEILDTGTEVGEEGTVVEFETAGFSVFAVAYTVDFSYEVNGKMYEFSLPGGGFVRLTDLLEVLGIGAMMNNNDYAAPAGIPEEEPVASENQDFTELTEAEEIPVQEWIEEEEISVQDGEEVFIQDDIEAIETDVNAPLTFNDIVASDDVRKFVADVESVEFSNPELVDVSKVETIATVGELINSRGLEVQYSAGLTEQQIAEINNSEVEAGDWALISLKAFDTEETLTVTMKNGEAFTICVTDAQIKKTMIDAKGATWEITVTYDDEAKIPNSAELKIEEILPEDETYEQYYLQSLKKAGVYDPGADVTDEVSNDLTADVTGDSSEELADLIASDNNENESAAPVKKAAADYARIFNIEIWADGQKVEPAADVIVNIRLLDAPEEALPQVVHFAKDGVELMELSEEAEGSDDEGLRFVTDEFSVYSVVYTVDFSYEINGKVYAFTMQGADSVSLRALIDALHVYEAAAEEKTDATDADSLVEADAADINSQVEAEVANDDLAEQDDTGNADLDSFMRDIETVTFSDEQLLVPAKVEEDTTVGKIKTALELFPTYPLGLKESEVLELNAKEYTAGDWALISMKAFDTKETLTITMNTGESFDIIVTDAQDAVMNGDYVQTISNPAGTTINLFDYWIVSQDIVGRDAWGDLNQSQGASEAGDDKPLNGTGNNKGINSSPYDTEHGHALKFDPAWSGTVYNGNKIGTTGNAWQSVNLDTRDGLNSYTGDGNTWNWNCPNPFTGIVQNNLSGGYPILTNNQNIGTTGESLAYLFDPGVSHDGKASYPDVNQLLYVDKDGYYTYDSRDYAAAFDTGNKTFSLTEQTSTNTEIRGFWPFGIQNFWLGMHVDTQFSMPEGGQVLNPSGDFKPMQFEFSGDDDVWIYVDGILVGDAGGVHNRTEVDINFQTGIVSISYHTNPDNPGFRTAYLDELFRTGLRDQGKSDAVIEEYIANNFDGHTFKANTYHTFDFFYLERGGGESNLYIHYNLVSTADFTAHKTYHGEDEEDILTRDQFQFELIGLDGKYRSVLNSDTGNYELVQEDTTSDAIMPHASGSGEGTVASPHYEDNVATYLSSGSAVNSQIYITGVTEDGNVNFGTAMISEMDMHDADEGNPPVYKYIIREIVPDDAVNQDGITWAEATNEQKAAGGFIKDNVVYDGTMYYMTGRVTSWTEADGTVRHGISKTYYTDDTYTTVRDDVKFVNFENRFMPDYGSVDFTKVDGAGDPLEGAAFTLYKDAACTVPATDLDTEGHPVWTVRSDEDGKVSFENVRVGTYYMKETEAPSDYALDETIYKVVIEDSKDNTKKSKITILGDEEQTAVTEIANAKSGKITVVKKWLNSAGTEVDGGSNSATVWLRRKHMVAEEGGSSGNHMVTVRMTVEDGGVQYGTPVTETVTGDTVVIEWDDEWQRNFDWSLTVGDNTYNGWIGDEYVSTDNYTFEQIDVDGRSRRLTIPNVQGNISLTTKYWINWLHSNNDHWNNLNRPVISGIGDEPSYVAAEDTAFNNEKHTQVLNGSTWSHTWNIGGSDSSHSGFDFPAMDNDGRNYLYYVVELDAQGNAIEVGGSPMEGYTLQGYSANNNTGISNQGVITVYNRSEAAEPINVVIKKTDNAENSTNYLNGAIFRLMYRADSSGAFANVSKEIVPELDSESKFTVPTAGITLTGLVDGQYQIQEVSPPAGYVITNLNPVIFTVSGGTITDTTGTIQDVRYTAATVTSDAEFIIPNEPGAVLPNTGGPGTRLFTILGIILMLGAAVMMWSRRRPV